MTHKGAPSHVSIFTVPLIVMVGLVMFAAASIFYPRLNIGLFWQAPVYAQQSRSAKEAYKNADYRVYCEEPNGNEVYVPVVNPAASGVAVTVVPGGCK